MRPRVEGLEQRALLSDLTISLTTDKPVYQPGQPIQFTFTETNNSNHPVNTGDGPSVDGFLVSENGPLVWQSNAGINPLFVRLITLQPGQSFTLKSTWNGVPNQDSPILAGGTFSVTNQLAPGGASASFQIESALDYSFSVDRSEYQVGEPFQIEFTETNASSQAVTVSVDPTAFEITGFDPIIRSGSRGLAQDPRRPRRCSRANRSPKVPPGMESRTPVHPPNTNAWGSFVVSSPNAPAGMTTAAFSIDDPLATTLTSRKASSSTTGQPVVLTWTETNKSTVPITIPDSDGKFTVSNASTGAQVFSATAPVTAATVALSPGQSFTQSVTWSDDDPSSLSPGNYYAVFSSTLAEGSTEFTITSPDPSLPPSVPPISVLPILISVPPDHRWRHRDSFCRECSASIQHGANDRDARDRASRPTRLDARSGSRSR